MKSMKKVLITGGNGYLGGELIQSFYNQGYSISILSSTFSRKITDNRINEVFEFSLGDDVNENVFFDIDIFIHCAYDFNLIDSIEIFNKNVLGSKKLFIAAKKKGVRQNIFISSVSAFEECVSKYGKTKLQIESFALDSDFKVLRPGVLFGGSNQGLIGKLRSIAQRSPIIPLVGRGNQTLYTLHVDDLALFIFKVIKNEIIINEPTVVASPLPYSFKQILINSSSDSSVKRKVLFIMIPSILILYGLKISEFFKINSGFRSDSLISLVNTPKNIDFEVVKMSNINFKKL